MGRLIGLAVLAGLTILVLANGLTLPSGIILNFLHLINLVFHEAGHVIFGFFGRFVAVLGGSVNQVLVPAVCTGVFLARRQYGSAAVTLFWTGVYPEALGRLQSSGSADHLIDFQVQGKRSYYVASTLGAEEAPVLRRLSDEFELCAFGLSRVRREWERHDPEPPRGPIRGVIGA